MFEIGDTVKVIATGAVGRIKGWHEGSGMYLVEFNNNFRTREWLADYELKLTKRKRSEPTH
jgi:hypothetical protein